MELSEAYAKAVRERLTAVTPEVSEAKRPERVSVPRGPGMNRSEPAGLRPRKPR
jgi:hypothetical protein